MVSKLSVFAIGLNIHVHFFVYSGLRKISICSEQQLIFLSSSSYKYSFVQAPRKSIFGRRGGCGRDRLKVTFFHYFSIFSHEDIWGYVKLLMLCKTVAVKIM